MEQYSGCFASLGNRIICHIGLSVGGLGFAATTQAAPVAEAVIPPVEPVAPIPVQSVSPTPVPLDTSTITTNSIQDEPKKSNWLLPIIALLVIAGLAALLFKQCSSKPPVEGDPVSSGASQAVADVQSAELQISTDAEGKLASCQAQSSSQSLLDSLKPVLPLCLVKPIIVNSQPAVLMALICRIKML